MSDQPQTPPPAESRRADWTIEVFDSHAAADAADRARMWAKTPAERLQEVERLRQLNYGYGPDHPLPRLQRVVRIFKLPRR